MFRKIFRFSFIIFLSICFFQLKAAAGPKVEFGDDGWLKLLFLGQFHYEFLDGAADEDDFFLRRGRIIAIGQITDGVKFFMETDNDKLGKNGVSASTDIQDMFLDVRLGDSSHWVKAGLILLPFSFETCSSAASLLGNDYNAEVVKLTNTFVWRDYGVELHGAFGEKVAYRVGLFDGYEAATKNPGADYRATGHLDISLLGAVSPGWFYGQNPLGSKQYLNIGVGFDSQSDATLITTETTSTLYDSDAWVADFQSCFPFGDENAVIMNGAYYDWENASFTGTTAFVEAGLLIDKFMVTAKWSNNDKDDYDAVDDYTYGIHYFKDKKHNLRAGLEFRSGDSADMTLLELQILC